MENKPLFSGNLNYKATKEELQSLLGEFGEVANINLFSKKGFAFVDFGSAESAGNAKDNLSGTSFLGRDLVIDWARPRKPSKERNSRSHFHGQGRSRAGIE